MTNSINKISWNIEKTSSGKIEGWAWDQNDPNQGISLRLIINGVISDCLMADIYREDLDGQGFGNGCHGFSIEIPKCKPGAAVTLTSDTHEYVLLNGFMDRNGSINEIKTKRHFLIDDNSINYYIENIDDGDFAFKIENAKGTRLVNCQTLNQTIRSFASIRINEINKDDISLCVLQNGILMENSLLYINAYNMKPKIDIFNSGYSIRIRIYDDKKIIKNCTIVINGIERIPVDISYNGICHVGDWSISEMIAINGSFVAHAEYKRRNKLIYSKTISACPYGALGYIGYIDKATKDGIYGWILTDHHDNRRGLIAKDENGLSYLLHRTIRKDVSEEHNISNDDLGFYISTRDRCPSRLTIIESTTGLEVLTINKNKNGTEHTKPVESGIDYSIHSICKPINSEQVAVIIPIYKDFKITKDCIESVISAKSNLNVLLVLINDNSPDREINEYIYSLRRSGDRIVILDNKDNLGFVNSVNMGFKVSGRRHVVILNSDTLVFDYWIDRLFTNFKSTNIATITPLSNNAEIMSAPIMHEINNDFSPSQYMEIDNICAELSGEPVELPVGIGFCMLINRAALDQLGGFSSEWGKGYGEEVDFCLRAKQKGFINLGATNLYIPHHGGVSFGNEKNALVYNASLKIEGIYPGYNNYIQEWLLNDPLIPAKIEITNRLLSKRKEKSITVAFVDSGIGGSKRYIEELIKEKQNESIFIVIDSESDRRTISYHTKSLKYTPILNLGPLKFRIHPRSYKQTIRSIAELPLERVIVNSIQNVDVDEILEVSKSAQLEYVIHDQSHSCPRLFMQTKDGEYCNSDGHLDCNLCINNNGPSESLLGHFKEYPTNISSYKNSINKLFSRADIIITGSKDSARRVTESHRVSNIKVVDYYNKYNLKNSFRVNHSYYDDKSIIRVGVLGAISDIKGFSLYVKLTQYCLIKCLPIHFYFIGYTCNDQKLSAPNVTITGRYDESNIYKIIDKVSPHLSLFLSRIPETYSYTLTEAFQAGIYPIVTDIGALPERVTEANFGEIVSLDCDIAEISRKIISRFKAISLSCLDN